MKRLTIAFACFGLWTIGCAPPGAGAPATLTGCIERGQATDTYVLKIAALGEQPTGTSGSTEEPTYRLDAASKDVDLQQHVGARVAVSGRLEQIVGTSEAPAAQVFHVASLRKIDDSCAAR